MIDIERQWEREREGKKLNIGDEWYEGRGRCVKNKVRVLRTKLFLDYTNLVNPTFTKIRAKSC